MNNATSRLRRAAVLLLAINLLLANASAEHQRTQKRDSSDQPRLVLIIVVDQFRYDYVERLADLFGSGGFRRLLNEGAFFVDANYEHLPTYTAVGHAAIFTGSVPALNGIVGNAYYDRKSRRIRIMVADDSARLVTSAGASSEAGAVSPRSLIGTTLGDQMRLATKFQSKVIAVSLKDRAAILPGGQRPNGAYWFSEADGEFVSSDYYTRQLPEWVRKFNAEKRPDKYFGKSWERLLPADAYARAQDTNLDIQTSALGPKFPHLIKGSATAPDAKFYDAFEITPFASDYLAQFAEAAVQAEQLGADQYPDLLAISFSSPDLCGHYYGPDSQEIVDTYARLDRTIGELLEFLDKKVGLANMLIAVTGDHGVAPVPEYEQSVGVDAMRLSARDLQNAVSKSLSARYGLENGVLAFVNGQLYLDQNQILEKKLDPAEVERSAGEAALSAPGVVSYFTRSQILSGAMPAGPISRRVTNGFNAERSGDVWVITRPFSFYPEAPLATTHGTPYNYDSHVPVIIVGKGIKAGKYFAPASPADIAPTLAALLGIEPPSNRYGRVLSESIVEKSVTRP